MPQTMNPNPQLNRVEAELSARIGAVFGRCPDLAGFSLQDSPYPQEELFVTDLGFSAPVSAEECDDVYSMIADTVADLVSERPEALELLRGRTFARTLH